MSDLKQKQIVVLNGVARSLVNATEKLTDKIVDLIEISYKNAPGELQVAVSLLNSAISATEAAYDAVSNAEKHATQLARSNVATVPVVARDAVKPKTRKGP